MIKVNNTPPKILEKTLKKIISGKDLESLPGDFEEMYHRKIIHNGSFRALIWYAFQIVILGLQYFYGKMIRSNIMVTNYLKITFRHIQRKKIYSFINIFGLALGIASFLLIAVYVHFEISFDKYHENSSDIYRLINEMKIAGNKSKNPWCNALTGPMLVENFSEVTNSVRLFRSRNTVVKFQDKIYNEQDFLYSDNAIFDIFSFKLLEGDPETVLKAPFTIVLTQEMAEKYFKEENALGKVLKINNDRDFTVTGVVSKPPGNSHFTFDFIASIETFYSTIPEQMKQQLNMNYYTYLLLEKGCDHREFAFKLNNHIAGVFPEIVETVNRYGGEFRQHIQPLTDIHLHSKMRGELGINRDMRYIYILSAIALLILITAGINFLNLTTVFASRRSKEVGLRKIMGSGRKSLVFQFIIETLIYTMIAAVIAQVLVLLVLPYANQFSGQNISLNFEDIKWLSLITIGIILVIGVSSGFYPAFFLSAFKPASIIKSNITLGKRTPVFRNFLVVVQFVISISLIICSHIIYKQFHFLQNRDPGFDKEQLLVLSLSDISARNKARTIKTEMMNINGVLRASITNKVPGIDPPQPGGYFPEGLDNGRLHMVELIVADPDFFDTYGVRINSGRTFLKEIVTDSSDAIIINETAAKSWGWENPIGKRIVDPQNPGNRTVTRARYVIGVINDMHFNSLYRDLEPTVIEYTHHAHYNARKITLKLNPERIHESIEDIEKKWREIIPDHPLEYYFLDDSFLNLYENEKNLGNIIRFFTILSVVIGCLGLFGLSAYLTEYRIKEIGIRKVLGSTIGSLVFLLNKEIILMVILSNIIAWPTSYFLMKNWLERFPYQTSLNIEIFIIAGIIAFSIAVLATGYRSITTALINPVNSLRHE